MAASSSEQRMSLSALVVGSMIGAGVFSLPQTFAHVTDPFGAIVGWCIAGAGMYALTRAYQARERKPDLYAAVYACARAERYDDPGAPSAFVTGMSHAPWCRKTNQ